VGCKVFESLPFRHIVAVDSEFHFDGRDGNRPRPVCLVARELRTAQAWRLWRGEFGPRPPFPTGPDCLFVSFYSSAECGFFRQLGWAMPMRVLDLFCEFRCLTNGRRAPGEKDSLISLLTYFSIDAINALDKREMIDLILANGPELESRRTEVLDYCQGDVDALGRVLPAILPFVDLPRALLRGRYMANGASAMEHNGIPVDAPLWERLVEQWDSIKRGLIDAVDADFHVYEDGVFRQVLFEKLLARLGIPWPRLESGHLDLSDDTFRAMAKSYPIISPLRELRHTLSELRLNRLSIGNDQCNRTILSAFRARTGRNQPSSAQYIFGPSVWIRGLIRPRPGEGLAYIDWSSQEIGIAAALSGDPNLVQAYNDGDTYLAFGKQCGRLPLDATKESHGAERELLKQCCLGINYAMGERSLALRLGQPEIVARNLLRDHRNTYPRFWSWSDAAVDLAMQGRTLWTTFGWPIRIGPNPNPRSLRNFPMQGHAAECLRIACRLGTERGVTICGPLHDAVLISAPLDRLDHDIAVMRDAMAEASRAVLGGFELRTDVNVIKYPDRFMDEKRGRKMWDHIMRLLAQAEGAQGLARAVG
jgi:DNA polymerase I